MTDHLSSEVFADRLRGMTLMGALGDALGAPHEHEGLRGAVGSPGAIRSLPQSDSFLSPGAPGRPWQVWADADAIVDVKGMVTDDTAFKVVLFQGWLQTALTEHLLLTEPSFERWLLENRCQPEPSGWLPGVWRSRQSQIAQWLEMFSAAREGRSVHFYQPGKPVIFGLFMYLELAVLWGGRPVEEVFRRFRSFSRLDEGYAGALTGILAALLAEGAGSDHAPEECSERLLQSARDLLTTLLNVGHDDPDRDTFDTARQTLDEMIRFGYGGRGGDERAFLRRFRDEVYNRFGEGNPFDPMMIWRQIVSALAFSGRDPVVALRLLAAGPGDSDSAASIAGTLIGAWTGRERLAQLPSDCMALKPAFDVIESNLKRVFLFDLEERVRLFTALRDREITCPDNKPASPHRSA